MTKIIHVFAILIAALLMVPAGVMAQQEDFQGFGPAFGRDRPRGQVQITNDWRDAVNVTMWTHRRERIGGSWEIDSGESAYLVEGGDRIQARPNYKIKVGNDWGWVNLGDVGRFRRGTWFVNVRDIWRATHQRGDRGDRMDRRERDEDTPDWKR